MSTVQDTRLSRVQGRAGERLQFGLNGPWFQRSLVLIALLAGFFLGSNVTEAINESLTLRSLSAVLFVVFVELLIRIRFRFAGPTIPLTWQLIDNVRIGFVYAMALEAFKVGS